MRFWDSSALAALLLEETRSPLAAELLTDDPEIAAWWGSPVECTSAIRRREREGSLSSSAAAEALALLNRLRTSFFEIQPGEMGRTAAERALAVHPLRAADALQLAAAITWRGPTGAGALVCLDDRLRDAAAREGFALLPAD